MNSLINSQETPVDIYHVEPPELEAWQDVNGRYIIGGLIADTNNSNVYDAIDGDTGERVAFKAHRIADTDMLGAFVMENFISRAFSRNGSNVVRHIDFGISQDYEHTFGFSVSEKMPGTMADLIKSSPDRKLDIREFGTIAVPALEAIDEMHGVSIVHADIKPSNIFYTEDNKGFINGGEVHDF